MWTKKPVKEEGYSHIRNIDGVSLGFRFMMIIR
jgi:hypothetical protein